MASPDRIAPLLAKLAELWRLAPDLRLGQLISNCAPDDRAIFFLGDEELERSIDTMTARLLRDRER